MRGRMKTMLAVAALACGLGPCRMMDALPAFAAWTNSPAPSPGTNTPTPVPSVYVAHLTNTNDPHRTLWAATNASVYVATTTSNGLVQVLNGATNALGSAAWYGATNFMFSDAMATASVNFAASASYADAAGLADSANYATTAGQADTATMASQAGTADSANSVPLSGVSGAGGLAASNSVLQTNISDGGAPFTIFYSNGTARGFTTWYGALTNMTDGATLRVRGSHTVAADPLPSNGAGAIGARTGCSIVGFGDPVLTATVVSNVASTAGVGFNFTYCTGLTVRGISFRTVIGTNYVDAAGNAYGWKAVGRSIVVEGCRMQLEVNSLNCTNAKNLVVSDPAIGRIALCDVVTINNCGDPVQVRTLADHDDYIGLTFENCHFVEYGVTNFAVVLNGTYTRFWGCQSNTNLSDRTTLPPLSWTGARAAFVPATWETYSNRYDVTVRDWPDGARVVAIPLLSIARQSSSGLTTFTAGTTNSLGLSFGGTSAIYWPCTGTLTRVAIRVGTSGVTGTNQTLRLRRFTDDYGGYSTNTYILTNGVSSVAVGSPPYRYFSTSIPINPAAAWYIDCMNDETQTVYFFGASAVIRPAE